MPSAFGWNLRRYLVSVWALALVLVVDSPTAQAISVAIYLDEADFLSSEPAGSEVIDFESFAVPQNLGGTTLALTLSTDLSITGNGTLQFINFEFENGVLTNSTSNVVFDFSVPVSRFGVLLINLQQSVGDVSLVYDEGNGDEELDLSALTTAGNVRFVRFIFDAPVSQLTFRGDGGGDNYFFDDIHLNSVPEPATGLLLAAALGAQAGRRRLLHTRRGDLPRPPHAS